MKKVVIVISVLSGAVILFTLLSVNRPANIRVKCSYMGYACGDCYPQFRVDSILNSVNKKDDLVGQDIYVFYKRDGREVLLEEVIDSCWICYDYYIEGVLKDNLFKSYKKIIAENYELVMRNDRCCVH